jgi:hypothetical protein
MSITQVEWQNVLAFLEAHYNELSADGQLYWEGTIFGYDYDYTLSGDILTINFSSRTDSSGNLLTPADPNCDTYTLQNNANKGTFPIGDWEINSFWNERLSFGSNNSLSYIFESNGPYNHDPGSKTISTGAPNGIPYTLNGNILKFNILGRSDSGGHVYIPSDPECDTWVWQDDAHKGTFPEGKWVNKKFDGSYAHHYVIFGPSGTFDLVDEYPHTYTIDTTALKIRAKAIRYWQN